MQNKRQLIPLMCALGALACAGAAHGQSTPPDGAWTKLATEPYPGKQDAIDFVTPDVGWYGNGKGRVFKTVDGGASWTLVSEKPGTYVRALGFLDAQTGYLGNIGTDYFPGVSDTTPLYVTHDGGVSWSPVSGIQGPAVKGICAIDIASTPFINAGRLDHKVVIRAGGRVGGPAFLMTSRDGGGSWESQDMSPYTAMILDIKFLDDKVGFIAGATDANIETSHALILRTTDGGRTWSKVYESARPWEATWKIAFPTHRVGYVTVQNYDPAKVVHRVVAKTTDGGRTWTEVGIGDDAGLQEFGVGFASADHGWIGTMKTGLETADGGKTWRPVAIGQAANKFKVFADKTRTIAYAVGVNVSKYVGEATPAP